MDSKVKEKESIGWDFLIDLSVLGNIPLESLRNMTLKAIFYTQDQIRAKLEMKVKSDPLDMMDL